MTDQAIPYSFSTESVADLCVQQIDAGAVDRTPAAIADFVDTVTSSGPFAALSRHRDQIINKIRARVIVKVGEASVLRDKADDHIPWIKGSDRENSVLWKRLSQYLKEEKRLPLNVLAELDKSTDITLGLLEDPSRKGSWDRRGLVVGHVQSGKTTHYTALMAKSLDAGYQIIIVLAGMHNNLRSQTHCRVDEQLIGRDSQGEHKEIGTARFAARKGLPQLPYGIQTCTNSTDEGDFQKRTAKQLWLNVDDGNRLVMVVKKNGHVLRRLRDWLRSLTSSDETFRAAGGDKPVLIIDDESDQASLNTNDPDDPDSNPTTINRLIRQLLQQFPRVGYVGYTATPFANIFVDSGNDSSSEYGWDLFPRSFVVSLKAPDNYLGPSRVFGHAGDESAQIPEVHPLPVHCEVPDLEAHAWLPAKHKKDLDPGPLPESMKDALRLFLLNCSIRALRGDESEHNSMLVHGTRFVDVQEKVKSQIEQEWGQLGEQLIYGSESVVNQVIGRLRTTWDSRLAASHNAFQEALGDDCLPLPEFDDVVAKAREVWKDVRVKAINGSSEDALSYANAPDGVSVIAVGGDKLSRGLTLEGLSVSYFLRSSSMFDTLMQMARWFGYRPRYGDLCRVYTTRSLYYSFRQISLATQDLRNDLDRMARSERTPKEFGLRVRTPGPGLSITAANKQRRGNTVQIRFAGEVLQALEVPIGNKQAETNCKLVDQFVKELHKPARSIRQQATDHRVWQNVEASRILSFLESYTAFRTQPFAGNCETIRKYIEGQLEKGELVEWTVVLMSKKSEATKVCIGGELVGLLTRSYDRSKSPDFDAGSNRYLMRGVCGTSDEALDLSEAEFEEAMKGWEVNDTDYDDERLARARDRRRCFREARPAERGLLLIFPIRPVIDVTTSTDHIISACISFPSSTTAQPVEYTVNEIWESEYGIEVDADENDESE